MLLIFSGTLVINSSNPTSGTPTLLLDDEPLFRGNTVDNEFHFEVRDYDSSAIGIRAFAGGDFDINVFEDVTFAVPVESSMTAGDATDFVVLDKNALSSPPNRAAMALKDSTSYVIEMENDVQDHSITDSWSGFMEASPGNPVIDVGPPGSWDDIAAFPGPVLYDGSIYKMWYSGYDGTRFRMGYATSSDGVGWTKYPSNPIIALGAPGSWDDFNLYASSILHDGITYHMWYSGQPDGTVERIGYASSPDGINWTKYAGNLCPGTSGNGCVFDKGASGTWDDVYVYTPSVIHDGTTYHMWYTGSQGLLYRIGYASSPDGIIWTKHPSNPVLNVGPPGSWEWDDVAYPKVIYDGMSMTYKMWYTGLDNKIGRTGYATSSDGISWTKCALNPVLDLGAPGSWNSDGSGWSVVIYDGMSYKMWFSGTLSPHSRTGYAESLDGITWKEFEIAEVLDAYEIIGIKKGSSYEIDLDVPATADLDFFIFESTGGRDDATASSVSIGKGIDESLSFIAPKTADYLLIITNEDGGYGEYVVCSSKPPIADAGGPYFGVENSPITLEASGSYDPDGSIVAYEWDLDGDGEYDDAVGINVAVAFWNDDYEGTIGLMVTDNNDLTGTATSTLTITNVDPTAIIAGARMNCDIGLRVAGSKWSNVNLTLYENGTGIGWLEVERWPGSPSANPSIGSLPNVLNMSRSYIANVTYDPDPDDGDDIKGDQGNNGKDPQNNAGNPVWLTLKCGQDSERRIRHTFNVQQSKKRGSDHWNHVEPWIVDINQQLVGFTFTVIGSSYDPGSDDITFSWIYELQSSVKSYLNNPPNQDQYTSPYSGNAPVEIDDNSSLIYNGPGFVLLSTSDDDEARPTDPLGTNSASIILS
jgi:predicted GH43/DUF377 family glycosyl hydrolase